MPHSEKTRPLTGDELRRPFEGEFAERWPPVLSPAKVAEMLGVSRSTIYYWCQLGRLDGAFRKRGKHLLLWRDRVIERIFNSPDWK